MHQLSTIRECNVERNNDAVCLTFDVDWACDEVLDDTISLLKRYNVPSTWFFTHETEYINQIRQLRNQEIGIHPNFNDLLNSSPIAKNVEDVFSTLKSIIPDATSMRSHSLTYGDVIARYAIKHGITHVSNYMIPFQSGISLNCWNDWYGLTHVPYLFQDSVLFYLNSTLGVTDLILNYQGLRVFNFHPIHVYLNTESIGRYEQTRHLHRNPKELIKYRYTGYGTRSRLIDLLDCFK